VQAFDNWLQKMGMEYELYNMCGLSGKAASMIQSMIREAMERAMEYAEECNVNEEN